jgi:hypothetical protein
MRVRPSAFIFAISLLSACGGHGASPIPHTQPVASGHGTGGRTLAIVAAPASLTMTQLRMPDFASGAIAAAPDGSVYVNGSGRFVRYKSGAFTTFAYPLPAGATGVGGVDGVNSIAVGPYGVIWTDLYKGGCCRPAGGAIAAFNPGTGGVSQTSGGSLTGDAFASVAGDNLNRAWVIHQTGAPCSTAHSDVYIFNSSLNLVTRFSPIAMPRLNAIVRGGDGMMYVASALACHTGVSEIARINPSTLAVLKIVTLPAGSDVAQMVAGPDGNIWYTNYSANAIGRLTPTGVITQYTLPVSGSQPSGITVGSDGALWFTQAISPAGQLRIGRISTTGAINEYLLTYSGPGFAAGAGITGGPPGAPFANTLYVVALGYPYLYKITI